MSRGRPESLSPTQAGFGSQIRSTSRGRDRALSNGPNRRQSSRSRARVHREETNYRWSIMTHDPYERFEPKNDKPTGAPNDDDDLSEEEQISDDEPNTDYDIAQVELPNTLASINDHYKKKSSNVASLTDTKKKTPYVDPNRTPEALMKKGADTQKLAEALALEKALEDAREINSDVPADMVEKIRSSLEQLGYKQTAKTDELVKLENTKEKNSQDYKAFVMKESKKPLHELSNITGKKVIVKSEIGVNKTDFRASRSITLGKFFDVDVPKDPKKIRSYIVYVDNTTDSLMALQYTIGCLVRSGDVIYVVHTSDFEEPQGLDYYKQKTEHFTNEVEKFLNELYDEDFKLHILVESTYRKYTKHFMNQLMIYLEPVMFVIAQYTLVSNEKFANYVPPCPFLVIKRKNQQKKK